MIKFPLSSIITSLCPFFFHHSIFSTFSPCSYGEATLLYQLISYSSVNILILFAFAAMEKQLRMYYLLDKDRLLLQPCRLPNRISRVPRLGLETPSLSIEDSYRTRTRSRCSRVNQTRNRNRNRSYGSCSNRLGICTIFQRFYRGKWSLRLEIPSLSTLDSESDSESVSMLSPV